MSRSVRVRVPATSANLGPGFDTLGLALSIADELEVTQQGNDIVVDIDGNGVGEVPRDGSNLIARSIAHVFDRVGVDLPGLHLRATNVIPHGRGLGSSGAAIVSGVMAAKGLLADRVELTDDDLLRFATELEGHPDNVAPALFGGLTIAWVDDSGPRHKRLTVHRGVRPLVAIPSKRMSTELARSLQPTEVPHADAVFNVSRSALLIAALVQSPELLFDATEDRLHQSYRAAAMPETDALVGSLRSAGHAAVVSGAGPSVLVLSSDPEQRQHAGELVEAAGSGWEARPLAIDILGASVAPLVHS